MKTETLIKGLIPKPILDELHNLGICVNGHNCSKCHKCDENVRKKMLDKEK